MTVIKITGQKTNEYNIHTYINTYAYTHIKIIQANDKHITNTPNCILEAVRN